MGHQPWTRFASTRRGRAPTRTVVGVLLAVATVTTVTSAPARALPQTTVWLAGDSTMANSSAGGAVGWGGHLASLLGPDARVVNNAIGGRSIQTWMYEGNVSSRLGGDGECTLTGTTPSPRWQATLDGMKAGDFLVIQFGINDGDRTCPRHVGTARYQSLMETMARAAAARGARPVLLTPTSGMSCSGSTAVSNRGFGPPTSRAGAATSSPVIDLTSLSVALYNRLRFCPNDGDYGRGALGAFWVDRTHFENAGARQIAQLVTTAVRNQQLPLSAYLKDAPTSPTVPVTTAPVPTPPVTPAAGSTLVSVASNRCLSAAAATAGSAVQIYDCTGSTTQQWTFTPTGELRTNNATLCLDATARGTTPGTKLTVYTCNGGPNQKFTRGPNQSIVGQQSNLCLDVERRATTNGTPVNLWTCNAGSNQQWTAATTTPPVTPTTPATTPTTPATTPTTPVTTQPTTPATTPASTPPATGTCSVTYTVTNAWTGGFTAEVKISSTTPVNGWTATWTFPGTETITNAWNATITQNNRAVTATNAAFNATIPAGGSATIGFQGTTTATPQPPTTFTLNGTTCS